MTERKKIKKNVRKKDKKKEEKKEGNKKKKRKKKKDRKGPGVMGQTVADISQVARTWFILKQTAARAIRI